MPSRMDKYYEKRNEQRQSRSRKNRNLYGEIFTEGKYSNIEGVTDISNNEVDLDKVRKLLEEKDENNRRGRTYRKLDEEPLKPQVYTSIEDKNYDINDILKEARSTKEPDYKERSLRNSEYNVTTNEKLKEELASNSREEIFTRDDVNKMINDIAATSKMNKLDDGLFDDLKDDETSKQNTREIRKMIESSKQDTIDNPEYDEDFFDGDLKLKQSDFGQDKKKTSVIDIIIIIVLILIMLVSIGILVLRVIK